MAEFYLNLGLKITRIYEFIEFHPQKCFEMLTNEILNSRREADLDKSKTVIALTNKFTGNSLYSTPKTPSTKQSTTHVLFTSTKSFPMFTK